MACQEPNEIQNSWGSLAKLTLLICFFFSAVQMGTGRWCRLEDSDMVAAWSWLQSRLTFTILCGCVLAGLRCLRRSARPHRSYHEERSSSPKNLQGRCPCPASVAHHDSSSLQMMGNQTDKVTYLWGFWPWPGLLPWLCRAPSTSV